MQNLVLFPYVHLHTTTFRVWKNNIGERGIKDFFRGGNQRRGGLFEKSRGGDKYPIENELLEHVAPRQGNSLKNMLFPDKNTAIDVPPEIEKLYQAFFSSSSNNGKCAILSLVPNLYSKEVIAKLFHCSRNFLDKAKKASYFQQINQGNFTKSIRL